LIKKRNTTYITVKEVIWQKDVEPNNTNAP